MFYFLICLGEPAHRTGKRSHNNKRNTKCEKGSSQTTSDNLFNDTARANTTNNKNNRANRTKRYSETKDDRKAGWSTGWPKSSGKKMISFYHRRRIKTEEKVKVVASVWGGRNYSVTCRASYFLRAILKKRMNSSFSFKPSWCNSSYYSKYAGDTYEYKVDETVSRKAGAKHYSW